MQSKCKKNKYQCDPLGCLCKLLIQRLGFALGEESICTAGDCTGKASALSALKKNDDTYDQAGYDLQDGENEL